MRYVLCVKPIKRVSTKTSILPSFLLFQGGGISSPIKDMVTVATSVVSQRAKKQMKRDRRVSVMAAVMVSRGSRPQNWYHF